MNTNLLEVLDLSVSFHTDDGVFRAVDNVSLHVKRGEIVGLIGEFGCGKSVTSLSVLKLIPFEAIPGQVPSPYNYPSGCHFRDRCPQAFDRCTQEVPPLMKLGDGHRAACWIADKLIKQSDTAG